MKEKILPNNKMKQEIVSQLAIQFLHLRNQLKIYHWQTQQYSKHKALDKLINRLQNLNDTWVETAMGKYGRVVIQTNQNDIIKLENINPSKDIRDILEGWQSMFIETRDKHFATSSDSDLSNIFDEMIAAINQTRYLLSLQ